jgi:hypothetical protein
MWRAGMSAVPANSKNLSDDRDRERLAEREVYFLQMSGIWIPFTR